jgi:hypothetical protein
MADTGWKWAASVRNIDKGGANWNAINEALGTMDGNSASCSILSSDIGDELNLYNYSMSVPANKRIDGIQILMYKNATNTIKDYHVFLMDDTSHKGENKAQSIAWPANNDFVAYGNATDLWSTSWTAEQVNASTFGCIVRAKNWDVDADAFVDCAAIKIYYSDQPPDHSMMMGM